MTISSARFGSQNKCCIRCPGSDICVDCVDLRDLGHQLAEAEELARRLRDRMAGVKSRINAKMDPVTGKLPVEVICRIFELYADLDRVKEQMITACWDTEHRSGPLPLGAVSRRWRDIAWTFPALWTTLALDLGCEGRALGPELVRQWLERASGQPLTIQFLRIAPSRVNSISEAFVVLNIINQFSGQWKVLDLSGLPYALLKVVNDSQLTDLTTPSVLTHICVGQSRFDRSGNPRKPILHSSRRHRPTFLSFVSPGRPIMLNIDWTSVTQMLIAQSLHSFLEVIPVASLAPLDSLAISFLTNDYGAIPSSRPVTQLRTLRHFSVTESPAGISSGGLYDTISLPSLRTFHMDSKNTNLNASSTVLEHLGHLFTRSACPLVHLELLNLQLRGNSLVLLLGCVPTLRTLKVGSVYDAGPIFSELSEARLQESSNHFLPLLSFLDIAITYPSPSAVWAPLADIWDDNLLTDLPLTAKPIERTEKPSLRKDLRVKLTLTCTNNPFPEHLMDRFGLERMIRLWELHRIMVPIKVVIVSVKTLRGKRPAPTAISKFYEQSYEYHFSGDWKNDDIHRSLIAMLSSSSS